MEGITKKLSELEITTTKEVVFEILIWLPAKCLMRFKCVVKAWNTLIRYDPNFVKTHIARSLARPSATHLLFQLDISPPLPPGQPSSNSPRAQLKERFPLQLAPHHYSDTRVVYDICSNQCNGLVCLYDLYRHKSQIYLYNITTGEIKALPSSLVKVFEYSKVPMLFLGFDPFTEKYKLLYVSEYKTKIKILTLGTQPWRELKLTPKMSSYEFFRDCIFLNWWRLRKDFNEKPTLWKRLYCYWPLRDRYEMRYLISDHDEVNKDLMKYNSDNSNLEQVASLVEVERSNIPKIVLVATTSFISAPTTLVFPNQFSLNFASNFVENIIPLSFVDV